MSKQVANIIESVLMTCGIVVSLADIQQILSIIILVLDVCWILFRCGYGIYQKIKTNRIEEIGDDIKTAHDELTSIKDSIPSGEEDGKK